MRLFTGTTSYHLYLTPTMPIRIAGMLNPFLKDDVNYAGIDALHAAARRSDPVILEVEVDEQRLLADTGPYQEASVSLRQEWARHLGFKAAIPKAKWKKLIESGIVPLPSGPHDWRTTLETVHSVVYDGLLPANRIVAVHADIHARLSQFPYR